MPITVARGTIRRILANAEHFILQVHASDGTRATAALNKARHDILNLDGGWRSAPGLTPRDRNDPKFVSAPYPAGSGPFIMVDGGWVPDRLLRTIPVIVARHLVAEGVTDAVITSPAGGGGPIDPRTPRVVLLGLFPPLPPVQFYQHARSEIPDGWYDVAATWVRAGRSPGADLWASTGTLAIQFPIAAEEGANFLRACREARAADSYLAAGDPASRLRAAYSKFAVNGPSHMFLADGGPGSTDDDLIGLVETLSQIARGLNADIAYGFVQIASRLDNWNDPRFANMPAGFFANNGFDLPPYLWVEAMCDELVFGPFPFQVLGPGHLSRLGGVPAGAQPLAGGKAELKLGNPEAWMLVPMEPPLPYQTYHTRDPRVFEAGWTLLSPCLLTKEKVAELREAKRAANIGRIPRGFAGN